MITEPEQFRVTDLSGKNALVIDVNFKPDDESMNECKVLRVTIGDKESFIAVGDLRAVLFAISAPEQQRKMLPLNMVTQRRYNTMLGVKAERNIKKGEMINFKVDIPLPPMEQEIMNEAARQIKKGLKLL